MLVLNHTARIVHAADFATFVPGSNEVEPEAWKQCVAIKAFAAMVKSKDLEEVHGDVPTMKPDDAVRVVQETYSLDLLGKWAETAKGEVASAIRKQVEHVNQVMGRRGEKTGKPGTTEVK